MRFEKSLFLLLCPVALCAARAQPEPPDLPWLKGPFLAPDTVNTPPKNPYIEPVLLISNTYGGYNDHWKFEKTSPAVTGINPLVDLGIGFTERFGLEILTSSITNIQGNKSFTHMEDTFFYLGYQLLEEDLETWTPNLRLIIQETFPTGKYQKFNPNKADVQSTGDGSFQTGPAIGLQKTFHPHSYYFSLQMVLVYLFPANVSVKGSNTYGGGPGTRGTIRPGQSFLAYLSAEFSITQRWAFTIDSQFTYQKASRFSGHTTSPVGNPESFQFLLSPELEYSFSDTSGLILGTICTPAGKNADASVTPFLAYIHQF